MNQAAHFLAAEIRPCVPVRRHFKIGICLVKINAAADWTATCPTVKIPHIKLGRPVLVVDDIEQDSQAAKMAGPDESFESVGPAVSTVLDREELGRVVAPTVVARKFGDGHDFDGINPQTLQVIE